MKVLEKRKKTKRIRTAEEKIKMADTTRKWRENNHKNYLEQAAKSQTKRRNSDRAKWLKFIADRKDLKCVLCGYDNCYAALDFHHFRGEKKINVSDITGQPSPFSKERQELLGDELKKCIVLCSNCHRELHNSTQRLPLFLGFSR